MKRIIRLSLLLIFFLPIITVAQQSKVFTGAKIIPISGEPIDNGVLVTKGDKIVAVGSEGEVDVPSNAREFDVSGKVIMPGLVDSHSHIGDGDGGDRSSALHPDARIIDSIDPHSETFKKALAGGVTTVNVMPGSGHLMSGQTAYLKLRNADKIEEMLFVDDPGNEISGGLKMANGTNSIGNPPFPGTRAKSAAMVRELFIKAQDYKEKVEEADGDPEEMPKRDIGMDALVEVLNGERIVHFHTHRHYDILTAIRLAEEFNFRLVLHHVSEAWKVADEIAKADVLSSIIVLDAPGGKPEASEIKYENGAVLEEAGATVGYHTDASITDTRLFLRSGAFGVRAGMSREAALKALTIENAKMMDLQDQVGTLEAGKDADFVVLSGDPLSVYTKVEQTWVEGIKRFDYSNPRDRKYSTGGYDVFRGSAQNHHHGDK
ncbi:amidohydrolase [Aliifodinibius salipaludis]|uniref:Amidohydrolase n=1 Tax=Fodinibius salipaludis TaxID=2032627 RepID=A0A2A2G7H6_9BACT|nr:amidohydrolase family protein [Aliifodinibius salipaludis]PAU92819.1 amidohydrolase [Aliifodinibius salipaludis]